MLIQCFNEMGSEAAPAALALTWRGLLRLSRVFQLLQLQTYWPQGHLQPAPLVVKRSLVLEDHPQKAFLHDMLDLETRLAMKHPQAHRIF